MPALPQKTQENLDPTIDDLLVKIGSLQDQYFALHKRYWQGIQTPTLPASEDTTVKADLSCKPTDQNEDWSAFGLDLGTVPYSVRIDVYEGPQGSGYVCTFLTEKDGSVFRRAMNYGKEEYRGFDWELVPMNF